MQKGSSTLKSIIIKEYVELDAQIRGLSPKTVKNRRNTLKRLFRFSKDLEFDLETCLYYVRHLQKKKWEPESIRQETRVIKALIKWLYKKGYIDKDFSTELPLIKSPKKQVDIVPLKLAEKIIIAGTTPGEGDNVVSKMYKKEYRQALRFMLRTGLRNRELRSLNGSDINIEAETFTVKSKSGDIDVLPLPRDMIPELEKRVDNGRLFKVNASGLNRSLKRGCKRLSVATRVRAHTLRHSFCTSLLKRGVSLQLVSRLMRHSSTSITDSVYSHYLIEDLSQALNSKHPLIRGGLQPKELFDVVQKAIEDTGVQDDSRVEVNLDKSQTEMVFRIKLSG